METNLNTDMRKFKSLITRTRVVFLIFLLFLFLAIVLVLNSVMLSKTKTLENKDISTNIERAENEIKSEIKTLSSIVQDYAYWDDTYKFANDGNEEYINENLRAEYIDNLSLDTMVFIDNSGKYIYAGHMDESRTKILPVSQSFTDYINNSPILKNVDPNYKANGIIQLKEGLMLMVSSPILNNSGEGPVRGNLVIGYYLNDQKIEMLSEKINLGLNIEQIDQLDQEKLEILNSIDNNNHDLVRPVDDENIKGYATLDDIYGNPAALLTIETSRNIMKIAKKEIISLIIMLSLVILIFTIFIKFYLDYTILKRLKYLSKEIRNIGENKLFSKRIKSKEKQDEITIVSDEINYMLGELEKSQIRVLNNEKNLKELNDDLESKVHERTMELYKINKSLQEEIYERKKIEEEIKFIAYHDSLTGLPNRVLFSDKLDNGINLAKTKDDILAVMFLDIDSFKMINDTMGHLAGDKLLRKVSTRLLNVFEDTDVVARIGGDEFLILIENIEVIKDVEIIANKVLKCFAEPFIIENQDCFVTTSIGIAVYPTDGENSEVLIKNADLAMYMAKDKGKNAFAFCTSSMKNNVSDKLILTNQLYRAIERKEFKLFYQPQVDSNTKQIAGVEALIRWDHPEMGIVSPEKFIHIAEQTGLIIPIGDWVLRTACEQNKMWQDAGYPKIRIGVNVSIKQFTDNNFASKVNEILAETGLEHKYLELEVTESMIMKEKKHIIETLNKFKDSGIHIAIDDFGTEYSSLNYLKNIPADRIKIAMPFVQGINVNSKDEFITKAIIVLARSMNMGLIAEGVENENQLSFLTQSMCDEIQGFYFYKPMPAEDVEKIFKK